MDIRWVAILAILISNEKHETLYKYLLAGLSLRAGGRGFPLATKVRVWSPATFIGK